MDVRPAYHLPDLSWLAREDSPLPEGFLWGAAVAAFQVEGGYNRPGEPENNWAEWERSGRVEPAGQAVRFWDDADRYLDLASGLGLSAFRLSVEWARLQRGPGAELDPDAVARYVDVLAGCRARGLEPVVTLHHFTHPSWLGADPWLDGSGPPAFEDFVTKAVTALGRGLADRGVEPVRWWITLNEPNVLPLVTHLLGALPHGAGSLGPSSFRRALDSLMAAHVFAYRAVHTAHERHGWDRPMVAFNNYCTTAYALDRGLLDLAAAREEGVARASIHSFLEAERPRFEAEVEGLRGPAAVLADKAMGRILLPDLPAALPRYVGALYAGEGRAHDYVAIDYYTPVFGDFLRFPDPQSWSERRIPFGAELWETTIRPRGLRMFLHANHRRERPLPVLVAENGMCTRVRGGMRRSRPDGWRRPAFIRAHVAELLQAARAGVPVAGYLHWSLIDNYEWGSYEPRFGLYGVDRRDGVRIMDTDADGNDSAGVYRDVIAGLASGKEAAVAALARD